MSNQAAWLKEAQAKSLSIEPSPMPVPDAHEVVIRNYALAINPVDWKIQDYGIFVTKYPTILGCDLAGVVHAVGSAVDAFKPGDRVLAHLDGVSVAKATNGGFQQYAATSSKLVALIPDSLSFTDASVLPLAISTAAAGMFQKDFLALDYPNPEAPSTPAGDKGVVLIWGGSSSVGSVAIQLAVAAGYAVATTVSARNFGHAKDLGATYVFDYTKPDIVDQIVSQLQGKKIAGTLDAISYEDTVRKLAEVVGRLEGSKFLALTLFVPKDLPAGIEAKSISATSIAHNEVSTEVWDKFVGQALVTGTLKPKPDALVIGKGLDKVQEALEMNKKGVSAKKVVVELD